MLNMKRLFDLPKEYEINKTITKKRFLENPNLTSREREELKKYINSIELVYDVRYFDNSELIFMDVEIWWPGRWTFSNISRIIAQSIPHKLFIYIHTKDIGRFIIYATRPSSKNKSRNIIEKTNKVWEFPLKNPGNETIRLIEDIKKKVLNNKAGASKVLNNCIDCINNSSIQTRYLFKHRTVDDYTSFNTQPKFEECKLPKFEEWELIEYGINFGYEPYSFEKYMEDNNLEYREDIDLLGSKWSYDDEFWDNYKAQKSFVSSLSNSAYAFYQDYFEIYDEKEWLQVYSRICNIAFDDLFNRELPEQFYQELGFKFYERVQLIEDSYYTDYVEELLEELI